MLALSDTVNCAPELVLSWFFQRQVIFHRLHRQRWLLVYLSSAFQSTLHLSQHPTCSCTTLIEYWLACRLPKHKRQIVQKEFTEMLKMTVMEVTQHLV